MTTPLIAARGVGKSFRGPTGVVTPVKNFDLTLQGGELVVLHGPSGSGKTTILHLLAGWERPDQGVVTWAGGTGSTPGWSEVAVIPQTLALLEELTVAENITLPLRAAARAAVELSDDLARVLEELSLTPLLDRPVDQISVGEQQRVMIARALATRPTVVLADEPTAHQDERNAGVIGRLLLETTRAGAACVLATRQAALGSVVDRARVIHRHLPGRPAIARG